MSTKSLNKNTAWKVSAVLCYTVFYLHILLSFLYDVIKPLKNIVNALAEKSSFFEALQKNYLVFEEYNMIYWLFSVFCAVVGCIILAVVYKGSVKRRVAVLLLLPMFYGTVVILDAGLKFTSAFSANLPTYVFLALFVAAFVGMYVFFINTACNKNE